MFSMGFDGGSIPKTNISSVFEVWESVFEPNSRWGPTQNPSKNQQNIKILKKAYFSPTTNSLKCILMEYKVSSEWCAMRDKWNNFLLTAPKSGKDNIIVCQCMDTFQWIWHLIYDEFPRFSRNWSDFWDTYLRAQGELGARTTCVEQPWTWSKRRKIFREKIFSQKKVMARKVA